MKLTTTAVLTSLALSALPCNARTWFVTPGGSGDAPTVQAAADSASPGDTVLVAAGTYHEQVHLHSPVTLRGTGDPSATTISADTGTYGYCVRSGGGVLIENLRFTGAESAAYGYYGNGGYALQTDDGVTVRNCLFDNDGGSNWSAGAIEAHGDLTVQNSAFHRAACVISLGSALLIEGCSFEAVTRTMGLAIVQVLPQHMQLSVSGSKFLDNALDVAAIGYDRVGGTLDVDVGGNLFAGNAGPAVAFSPMPITAKRRASGGSATLSIHDNTIARCSGYTIGGDSHPFGSGDVSETITLRRNAITGNGYGPYFPNALAGGPPTIECNDVWANAANWTGIPDPTGTAGNISLEPKYCDAAHGAFTIATNSPLRSTNNPCHVQIGAFGVACGPVSIEPTSWGIIKALYR